MLSELATHSTEIKLTLATLLGVGAWLADASAELNVQGWEELTLKGVLLAALVFVGRLFLEAQRSHKAEIKDTWDAHKKDVEIREAKLQQCIADNTQVLQKLSSLTQEQTDYFKAVTRNVVAEKLTSGKPTLP